MGSVKLTLNIGAKDAKRLNLKKTLRGESVSVSKDVEEILVANGWAIRAGEDGPSDEAIEAAERPTNAGTFPVRQPRVSDEAAKAAKSDKK